MFKILDITTGLQSSGGYEPSWSEDGKAYGSLGEIRAHLSLYCRGRPVRGLQYKTVKSRVEEAARRKRRIPTTWVVVEFLVVPVRRQSANQVARQKLSTLGTGSDVIKGTYPKKRA